MPCIGGINRQKYVFYRLYYRKKQGDLLLFYELLSCRGEIWLDICVRNGEGRHACSIRAYLVRIIHKHDAMVGKQRWTFWQRQRKRVNRRF